MNFHIRYNLVCAKAVQFFGFFKKNIFYLFSVWLEFFWELLLYSADIGWVWSYAAASIEYSKEPFCSWTGPWVAATEYSFKFRFEELRRDDCITVHKEWGMNAKCLLKTVLDRDCLNDLLIYFDICLWDDRSWLRFCEQYLIKLKKTMVESWVKISDSNNSHLSNIG